MKAVPIPPPDDPEKRSLSQSEVFFASSTHSGSGVRPVTLVEVANLSRWARVAFAVRCACRAVPAMGRHGTFEYWAIDARRHFGAIECALLGAFNAAYHRSTIKLTSDAIIATNEAIRDYSANRAAAAVFGAAEIAHSNGDSQAYDAHRSAEAALAALASSLPPDAADDVIDEARTDLENLREISLTEKMSVPKVFFGRPLWRIEPVGWAELCANFHRALESIDRLDAWERFLSFLRGEKLPNEKEIGSVFAAWEHEFGGESEPVGEGPSKSSRQKKRTVEKPPASKTATALLALLLRGQADAPSQEDRLNFAPHVAAVAEFVSHRETRTPLTLSVEGRWGSGKSSFMRQLEAALKKGGADAAPITTVRFNAWRHEKNEQLWAAFALAFFEQTAHAQSWSRRARCWLAFKWASFDWERGWPDALQAMLLGIRWMAVAVVGGLAIHWGLEFDTADKILATAGGMAGLFFAAPKLLEQVTALAGNPLKTELKRHFREQDYEAKVSFLHKFQDEFARFCHCYLDGRRVVVFVDDLDRCDVPRAAELMQGLNLMIADDVPVVFVLGIDRAKVAAGLAVKHEKLLPYLYAGRTGSDQAARGIEYGYDFLEKFIQVPFRLPRPSAESLANLLTGSSTEAALSVAGLASEKPVNVRVEGVVNAPDIRKSVQPSQSGQRTYGPPTETLAQSRKLSTRVFAPRDDGRTLSPYVRHVADVLERNPRRILQFVNCFRLQAYVADRLGLLGENGGGSLSLGQLVQLVAVSLRWPLLIADYDAELAEGRNLFERILVAKPVLERATAAARAAAEVNQDTKFLPSPSAETTSKVAKTARLAAQTADAVAKLEREEPLAYRWASNAELVAFLQKPLPMVSAEETLSVAEASTETLLAASASIAPEREVQM